MGSIEKAIYNRSERLLGEEALQTMSHKRVIVFGVGGVGSWCAESLVRSGFTHLTIVDSDRVCITNVNRQLMATVQTVGMVKVEALKERLLSINPNAEITALQKIYTASTADEFELETYDYIVDAIDSLQDKVLLILNATRTKAKFFSSMGAALKIDPTKVAVAEFWKVKGCPLGAALRRRFKRDGVYPSRKFKCVYSDELLPNLGENHPCDSELCQCSQAESGAGDPALLNHKWDSKKAQINGSLSHITAIFGFTIAGLILQDAVRKS